MCVILAKHYDTCLQHAFNFMKAVDRYPFVLTQHIRVNKLKSRGSFLLMAKRAVDHIHSKRSSRCLYVMFDTNVEKLFAS